MLAMEKHAYGHRPPDIGAADFGGGWIRGVRHLASRSAKGSFWHRHEETAVVCCLHGEYTYEFHGIPPVALFAGQFLVIPAQCEHRHIRAIDPIGDRLEILLAPNPPRTLRHSAFTQESCRTLHAALLKRALVPAKCGKELLDVCRQLHALAGRTARALSPEELGLARILCQYALYRMSSPPEPIHERAAVPFADIMSWLEKHLAEKIDLDRLVAHIGYSRTQVFTLFRKHTGLTPVDCLTRLRVRRACQLLETSNQKVCDIALACGFMTSAAFNATFRKQCGVTPLQWRARAGELK